MAESTVAAVAPHYNELSYDSWLDLRSTLVDCIAELVRDERTDVLNSAYVALDALTAANEEHMAKYVRDQFPEVIQNY